MKKTRWKAITKKMSERLAKDNYQKGTDQDQTKRPKPTQENNRKRKLSGETELEGCQNNLQR